MRKCLLSMLALLLLPVLAFAQAGDAPLSIANAPGWTWRIAGQDDSQIYLFRDGRQVGAFNSTTSIYRPLTSYWRNQWGEAAEPPHPLPHAYRANAAHFGVGVFAAPKNGTTYKLTDAHGTREVTRDEAMRITKEGVPDYANRGRIVVIGSEGERKRVLDDITASQRLAALKDKTIVQGYAPDHWHVKDVGYKLDGHPSIYVQGPSGKVLHAQYTYGGAGDLDAVARALEGAPPVPQEASDVRKPDPALPATLPDLRNPLLAAGGAILSPVTASLAVLCVGLGGFSLVRHLRKPA